MIISDELAFFLQGLIIVTMVGFAMGSYATSFTFRLPRNIPIFNADHPFCDECRTFLEPRDLFPIIGWVWNRGKCRFCSTPVPIRHTIVECAVLYASIVAWAIAGFSEMYILLLGLGMLLVIVACIDDEFGEFTPNLLWTLFVLGAIRHSLQYGALDLLFTHFVVASVVCWGIYRGGKRIYGNDSPVRILDAQLLTLAIFWLSPLWYAGFLFIVLVLWRPWVNVQENRSKLPPYSMLYCLLWHTLTLVSYSFAPY